MPLVERALRFEVRERITAEGEIHVALDEASVHAACDRLEAAGVDAVAIMFLHSYVNPAHETRTSETVHKRLPHAFVTASHELSREYREFERCSTVVANAYIGPVVSEYLRGIDQRLGPPPTPGNGKKCNSSYGGAPPSFDRPHSSWQHSFEIESNSGEVGMDPMAMLALATVVFLVTHYVSSTPLRSGLVALLGENGYLGLYTLVSLVTFGWMIWAYPKAPYERLWVGDEFKVWAVVLMPVSLVLIACGALSRNPSAVRQESALRAMGEPRGILRVTRHPILWGIALWAAVHLISRGDTASLIFFGGLLLLAISGTVLQDWRKDRMIGVDWQRFAATTSNIPFAAILQGRNQFRFDEIGWGKVLAGLALYFVLVFLHPHLFGARPY